jgi:hypothetical protein
MALYVKDRKKLWGLAAAKCSICRCDLFIREESDTNIGKECHISSHSPDHPSASFSRYDSSLTDDERDKSYDNAILLCGHHHDVIDNPQNTEYTIKKLRQIKTEHEVWVSKNFGEFESKEIMKMIDEVNIKFDEFVRLSKELTAQKDRDRERDRAIKMLDNFITPLIVELKMEICNIDDSLDNERFGWTKTKIRPNYKFIYKWVVDNKDNTWIRRKVDEYNKLVTSINDTKPMFEEAIEQSIKQKFPDSMGILKEDTRFLVFSIANNDRTLASNTEGVYGFWNEHMDELLEIRNEGELLDRANKIKQSLSKAKKVASELKDRLEELKGQYMEKCDVWEPEIEIKKGGKRVAVIQK